MAHITKYNTIYEYYANYDKLQLPNISSILDNNTLLISKIYGDTLSNIIKVEIETDIPNTTVSIGTLSCYSGCNIKLSDFSKSYQAIIIDGNIITDLDSLEVHDILGTIYNFSETCLHTIIYVLKNEKSLIQKTTYNNKFIIAQPFKTLGLCEIYNNEEYKYRYIPTVMYIKNNIITEPHLFNNYITKKIF